MYNIGNHGHGGCNDLGSKSAIRHPSLINKTAVETVMFGVVASFDRFWLTMDCINSQPLGL